uniref:Uncharacterized protein n=1 Tax=Chaetoceros debilis TaxID=122233 RepID=A0A7S3VGK4_9STRA
MEVVRCKMAVCMRRSRVDYFFYWLTLLSLTTDAFMPVSRTRPRSTVRALEQIHVSVAENARKVDSTALGFGLSEMQGIFNMQDQVDNKVGTNKEKFLRSLSSLDSLNESNSERTRLLENILQEKLSDGKSIMEEEITPTPRLLNPGLSSTFDEVASGKWKVVYAPHITTIAGLFGGNFDVEYNLFGGDERSIVSHAKYTFPIIGTGFLSVSGTYDSVDKTSSRVDFNKIWFKPIGPNKEDLEPYSSLEEVPDGKVKYAINEIGKSFFIDAVSIFPVSFLDENLIVFDFALLGTRICAIKQ